MEFKPAVFKENRDRVCDALDNEKNTYFYLKGGEEKTRYNTDVDVVFRQEAMFMYCTGCVEPGYTCLVNLETKEMTLFMPRLPAEYAVWMGHIETPEEKKAKFNADKVYYVDQEAEIFGQMQSKVFHLKDGAPTVGEGDKNRVIECSDFLEALIETRVIKSAGEMEYLQNAADQTSYSFRETMKGVKPGMMEYQVDATIQYHAYMKGLRFHSFPAITAAGNSASTLHYITNDKEIKPGQLMLIDAGFEDHCYAADISRTFPVSGKFTARQKALYEIVLKAQYETIAMLKPGVEYEDLHRHSNKVIGEGLHGLGLITGDLTAALDAHVPALFMSHGLGHLLGMEVHDVGGYPKGTEKLTAPGERNLRLRRTLKEGMVVTIEPGMYFVPDLLLPAYESAELAPFLCREKIEEYAAEVGGIRIEDDIVITKDGHRVLTNVPKDVEELEAMLA